jgi:transcriptional regulator with XRE-family HTH domain
MGADSFGVVADARLLRAFPPARVRKALREAVGASQRDVATELGVSAMAVSRWEKDRTPRGDDAVRYLRLLSGFADLAARLVNEALSAVEGGGS